MTQPAPVHDPHALSRGRGFLLLLLAWSVPAVISAGQTYFLLLAEGQQLAFGRSLLIQLPLWWYWVLVTPMIGWLLRRWPLERGRLPSAIPVHVLVALVTAVLHSVVTASYSRAMMTLPPGEALQPLSRWVLGYLRGRLQFELLTYALVLLALQALRWYRHARDRELTESRLKAQLSQAELLALKMQLHPHFLFNTLHAVSVLIRENPVAAQRTVTLLGDLLRVTLANAGVQEVTLAEELRFLKRYLEIEEIRFQDRLSVGFEVDPAVEGAQVPNLILQPLVENAVRHGVEPRTEPGSVVIRAERREAKLVLTVLDDGPGIIGTPARDGIGLSTTRARLRMLYGDQGRVGFDSRPGGGLMVTVELPFRTGPVPAAAP